jgi:hypothetical protein
VVIVVIVKIVGDIMDNNHMKEILKQGTIILEYYGDLGHGFKNITALGQICPADDDESNWHFVAITNKGQIINTLDTIQQFKVRVHPFIVPFQGSYVALKTRNAREVVGLDGKTVAEFPHPVGPQIVYLADGSFVALEKEAFNRVDCCKIISTGNAKYQPFSEDVWPTLVPGKREGEFHAVMTNDNKTVLTNLFNKETTKYGSLPRFKESIDSDLGHIIRIGDVFVTLTKDNIILGTDKIVYGVFNGDVNPESLTYQNNKFHAIDAEPSEVYFRTGPKFEDIKSTKGLSTQVIGYRNKKCEEYKTLDEVPRTVTIEIKKLEKILSEIEKK